MTIPVSFWIGNLRVSFHPWRWTDGFSRWIDDERQKGRIWIWWAFCFQLEYWESNSPNRPPYLKIPIPENLHRTRQVWSGICVCGHSADRHHGNMVMNPEAVISIGYRFAGECEAYGCNESWKPCPQCYHNYIDREDPLRFVKIAAAQGL